MRKPREEIACGHKIGWRWKSVGQDGAFCDPCQRVFPILKITPVPRRVRVAEFFRTLADRVEGPRT